MLLLAVIGGLCWVNIQFAKNNPGGNDFLVHYVGTRSFIYEYTPANDSINIIETPEYALFTFLVDDDIYTGSYSAGIMKFENDTFVNIPGGDHFIEMNISGLVKFDSSRYLVATFFSGIFLLDIVSGKIDPNYLDKGVNEYFRTGQVINVQSLKLQVFCK